MSEESWTIARVLAWAADDLRQRGSASPRLDAELLLAEVLSTTRVGLITDSQRPLGKPELSAYRALHKRRRGGEPVAYLLGRREFFGRRFAVDARVLVPRPETEVLVEVALARTERLSLSARTLDLCTGSGCVAVTLACERPTTCVVATDLSSDALEVAHHNAARLGAHHVAFAQGDLFEALAALGPRAGGLCFDLVTANAPYIPTAELAELSVDVRDHEPTLALDGGRDGLDLVRRIVRDAPRFLAPGGVLALELAMGQAPEVASLLEQAGFEAVLVTRDYAKIERVVSGVVGHK